MPIHDREVSAQIWRVAVGRVPLFLLDADLPENGRLDRWITSQLYVADPVTRLAQYALLGVGGVRALAALGIEPAFVHLNEGHAAFAVLELARGEAARGAPVEAALQAARQRTVFTTHTPVAAGNETYPREQVIGTIEGLAADLGDPEVLMRLGRYHPQDGQEPFGMTTFSLRMSRSVNGVSRRHGTVAREMWRGLWPERSLEAVPITHVTNGVHLPSWVGAPMRRLLDRHLAEDWRRRASEPATWEALDRVPDGELWEARREQRAELVEFVKDRSGIDRLAERQPRPGIEAAARAFDPDALTIGFARRNATYKRIGLLTHDPARTLALLAGPSPCSSCWPARPIPAMRRPNASSRSCFASRTPPTSQSTSSTCTSMTSGWPPGWCVAAICGSTSRDPPYEASGTSGMKAVINGGLNLSTLDGWWAEAYDQTNGWALAGEVDRDSSAQDARDAAALFDLLEQQVLPAFYDRDPDGLPHSWLDRIRASIRTLAPAFCAGRMLDDYLDRIYAPTRPSACGWAD